MTTEKRLLLPFVQRPQGIAPTAPPPATESQPVMSVLSESDIQRLKSEAQRHRKKFAKNNNLPDDEQLNDLLMARVANLEESLISTPTSHFPTKFCAGEFEQSNGYPWQLHALTSSGKAPVSLEQELRLHGAFAFDKKMQPVLALVETKRLLEPIELHDNLPIPPLLRQSTQPSLEIISVWALTVDGRFVASRIGIVRTEEGQILPGAPEYTFAEEESQPTKEIALGDSFFEGYFMCLAYEAMLN